MADTLSIPPASQSTMSTDSMADSTRVPIAETSTSQITLVPSTTSSILEPTPSTTITSTSTSIEPPQETDIIIPPAPSTEVPRPSPTTTAWTFLPLPSSTSTSSFPSSSTRPWTQSAPSNTSFAPIQPTSSANSTPSIVTSKPATEGNQPGTFQPSPTLNATNTSNISTVAVSIAAVAGVLILAVVGVVVKRRRDTSKRQDVQDWEAPKDASCPRMQPLQSIPLPAPNANMLPTHHELPPLVQVVPSPPMFEQTLSLPCNGTMASSLPFVQEPRAETDMVWIPQPFSCESRDSVMTDMTSGSEWNDMGDAQTVDAALEEKRRKLRSIYSTHSMEFLDADSAKKNKSSPLSRNTWTAQDVEQEDAVRFSNVTENSRASWLTQDSVETTDSIDERLQHSLAGKL